MLISPEVSKHNVFIKLSSYQGAFMQYVYKSASNGTIYLPEDFQYASPRLTRLHDLLYKTLTTSIIQPDWNDYCMQPNSSYSEYAMALMGNSNFEKYRNYIPDNNENLFSFALPDCYKCNAVAWAYTSDHAQLTPSGAATFRKLVKLMFWVALSWHIDNVYEPTVFPNKMEVFEDFVSRYGIPDKDVQTIYRVYSRERTSCMRIVNQLFDKIDPVRPIFFLKKT